MQPFNSYFACVACRPLDRSLHPTVYYVCTVKWSAVTDAAQIRIDLDSAAPVTRQIVDQLRTLLVEGAVAPDDTLPSVRRLAIDLGVHFNTVADAYRMLAEEGWLEISQGRGVRVRQRPAPHPGKQALEETLAIFRQRLRQLVAEMRAQGLSSAAVARELAALLEVIKS
jgi:GntR family transcriptional regulator